MSNNRQAEARYKQLLPQVAARAQLGDINSVPLRSFEESELERVFRYCSSPECCLKVVQEFINRGGTFAQFMAIEQ